MLPKTASEDEIKSAFRKLARKYHPDVAKDKKTAGGEIQTDQRSLRSPERSGEAQEIRSARRELESARRISTAAGLGRSNSPAADFIATVAKEMAASNLNLTAPVSAISSKRFLAAAVGDRLLAAADLVGDQGVRRAETTSKPISWFRSKKRCTERRERFRCAAPVSNKVETYQVKIPRGVHEGQRIRLAGQGEAGERGGKSGDLVPARAAGAASGFYCRRQRSDSRGKRLRHGRRSSGPN